MKTNRITILSILLMGVIFGTIPLLAAAFNPTPDFTDPIGDQIGGVGEDAKNGWVDNNDTHLLIKIEFVGAFTIEDNDVIYILIGMSTTTGTTTFMSTTVNFTVNYVLEIKNQSNAFVVNFFDLINGSNDLTAVQTTLLAYFLNNSAAHTIEIGYRFNTYSGGKGYMAINAGQVIKIQTKTWLESDWAPNRNPFLYSMKQSNPFAPVTTTFLIVEYIMFGLLAASCWYFGVHKSTPG